MCNGLTTGLIQISVLHCIVKIHHLGLCHTVKSKEAPMGFHGRDHQKNNTVIKSAMSAAFLLLPGQSEADSNNIQLVAVQDVSESV